MPLMTPDPTFYPSPAMAAQSPPEKLAYLSLVNPHTDGRADAIGVVETATVASAIIAADVALKTATIDLFDLRIANGLDGKSFLSVVGPVSDVRSSVTAAAKSAESKGKLLRSVVIPRPHPELSLHL